MKKKYTAVLISIVLIVVLTLGFTFWRSNPGDSGEHKEEPSVDSDSIASPEAQVKAFVENFGRKLSTDSGEGTSTLSERYGDYVSTELLEKWQESSETSSTSPRNLSAEGALRVGTVQKQNDDTYRVQASFVASKDATSSGRTTKPELIIIVQQKYSSAGEYKLTNGWVITSIQEKSGNEDTSHSGEDTKMGTTTQGSQATTTLPVKSEQENGWAAAARYTGENTWKWTITGKLPTPCYSTDVQAFVAESYPEQVSLTLSVTAPAKGVQCIQVIKPVQLSGTYQASEKASFSFHVSANNAHGNSDTPVSHGPGEIQLFEMSPQAGSPGDTVILTGSQLRNVKYVHFGPGVIPPDSVKILSDTKLTFPVTRQVVPPCALHKTGVHCMLKIAPLTPGKYPVYLTTSDGAKTKSIDFKLTKDTAGGAESKATVQ